MSKITIVYKVHTFYCGEDSDDETMEFFLSRSDANSHIEKLTSDGLSTIYKINVKKKSTEYKRAVHNDKFYKI